MKTLVRRAIIGSLDRIQRLLARSAVTTNLAVLVRNQCRCVIKYRLNEGPNVADTGEVWLQRAAARNGGTFIDVGANVGEWVQELFAASNAATGTEEARRKDIRVYAYEPSLSAYTVLQKNFAGDARIKIFPYAVGDRAETKTFFEEANAGKGSSFVNDFSRTVSTGRSVEIVTLDDQARALEIDQVHMLKIDAEGFDLLVLRGAARLVQERRIDIIQFEYNRAWQLTGSTLYEAMSLLQSSGYSVYVLKRDGLYTLNYKKYEEYFEYTNFVAIGPAKLDVFREKLRGQI